MPRATIGCVKFLNARPLIDSAARDGVAVRYDAPSGLLADLECGSVDIALCPVIDYQRSRVELSIVPVGGICCHGPTLTVRLFSRVPLETISELHADTDSHTSVALAQVVLRQHFGVRPRMIDFDPAVLAAGPAALPDTVLLIGDKVVTDTPPADDYEHQLDLGEVWHEATGGPFVFAVWMARRGAAVDGVARMLQETRIANQRRIDAIADAHAGALGWPIALARQYLGSMLHYHVGADELSAMQRFWRDAAALKLIDRVRPLDLAGPHRPVAVS